MVTDWPEATQLVNNPRHRPRLTHAQSSSTNQKQSPYTTAHQHTHPATPASRLLCSTTTLTFSRTFTSPTPHHSITPPTTTYPHHNTATLVYVPYTTPHHTHTCHTHSSSTCVTCISYSSAPLNTNYSCCLPTF